MVTLWVGSTGDRSGQSLITWAVAQRLQERGLRVGFLKPLGPMRESPGCERPDPDADLFCRVLGLGDPAEWLAPPLSAEEGGGTTENGAASVLSPLLRDISREKDVLLVMGSREIFLDDGARPDSDISLVQQLDAHFLLVSRYRDASHSLYSILSICSLLRERVKAVFLNRVPPDVVDELRRRLEPVLSRKELPRTTLLEEDPLLSCRTLREAAEVTSAEILSALHKMDQPFEAVTLGSGDLSGELGVFRRVYNKIVLLQPPSPQTRGDSGPGNVRRIAGLLLTAGRQPPQVLLDVAQRADVPLLLVKTDTFATLDILERNPPSLTAGDGAKLQRVTEMLDREGALDDLVRALHLP
jgi:BioD-like phosphotransacetylase family protein